MSPSTCLRFACATVAFALASATAAPAALEPATPPRTITIGTGGVTALYFELGRQLCGRINALRNPGLRCRIKSSPGSLQNLSDLQAQRVDFAFVQSDLLDGHPGPRAESSPKRQRVVAALYPEFATLVAREGVESLAALKNMRVNQGPMNSGHRQLFERLLPAMGLAATDFKLQSLPPDEHTSAFCNGQIDAFFFTVGFPNTNVMRAVQNCNGHLVPIRVRVDGTQAAHIPAAKFLHASSDVPSASVLALLVAGSQVGGGEVTRVLQALCNLKQRPTQAARPLPLDHFTWDEMVGHALVEASDERHRTDCATAKPPL